MQFTRFGIGRGRSGRLLAWSLAVGAGVGVVAVGSGFGSFEETRAAQPAQPGQAETPPQRGAQPDLGAMLVQGLKETEGCLGVDAAQFQSGKNTIVAWFENKAAAVRWYHSPVHARLLGGMGANPEDGEPLKHVTDENTPIMVMASISFGGEPAVPGSMIPFSQISIEMYAPLPGGASISGRLAPKAFEVPHHRVLGE